MTPALHWLGLVVQLAPDEQATHVPVLHTPPGHEFPVITFPFSMQTGPPVLQSVAPVRQTFEGVQLAPCVHGTHAAFTSHTPPGHGVPAGFLVALTHTGAPVLQLMAPKSQWGFGFVVQLAP